MTTPTLTANQFTLSTTPWTSANWEPRANATGRDQGRAPSTDHDADRGAHQHRLPGLGTAARFVGNFTVALAEVLVLGGEAEH